MSLSEIVGDIKGNFQNATQYLNVIIGVQFCAIWGKI